MKKFWKGSYFALIMLFIYVPIIVMIVFSFNSGDTVSVFKGWSGKWYDSFFHNIPFWKSIITSLFVAVVATLISVIIGTMAAIGLSKCKSVTQKAWYSIANIPLINADVVTAVSLMMVFMLSGIKFGIGTLLMAHVSFDVPYVLITVMPRLRKVDKSMIEAAQDLGAKPYQVLFRVILPVLRPAIITAAVIAFSMSFDDFIISYFTGGGTTNVSTFIYTAKNIKPYIFAFGTILVAVIFFLIIAWNLQSAIRTKASETKVQVEKGIYKQSYINKINQKLSKEYVKLNERKEIVLSKNPFLWIHYWYLKMLIKLYSIKNFDKRISKLEWKQAKIRNEIRNEKRYYSRLKKTAKSIKTTKLNIAKAKLQNKSVKKLEQKLGSLVDKKDYLESEIEWIENRDEKQERKAAKINHRIKQLNKELKQNFDSLSKSDISWYRKKIKDLQEWKIEVEEGKAHYKLRMTTEKLRELKDIRNNKIFELAKKAKAVKAKIFEWKDLGYKFDHKLDVTRGRNDFLYANALVSQDRYVDRYLKDVEWRIIKNENKIESANEKMTAKREKYFPTEEQPPKPRNWLQRSWKWLAVLLVAAGAFSGLTVAYVKENTYDLTIGNWGEYIDTTLINKFQKETGLKVNYQVYDSNETLHSKLYTFDYDVMIPSDYMVQRLAVENRIQKLDWSKLNINVPEKLFDKDGKLIPSTNDANKQTIDTSVVQLMENSKVNVKGGPDNQTILNYAVPYFWGDLSIVFNTKHDNVRKFLQQYYGDDADYAGKNINLTDGFKTKGMSWDVIRQAKAFDNGFKISLQDDAKNLFLIADEALYGKVNFKNADDEPENEWKDHVDNARKYITDLIHGRNVRIQSDDMFDDVEKGNFDIAQMYSGDLLRITRDMTGGTSDNYPYSYVRPFIKGTTQRTNIYTDNMTINKDVKGKKLENAYKFINFMFEKDNAAQNSESVGLGAPNKAAADEVIKDQKLDDYEKELYQPIMSWDTNYDNGKNVVFLNNPDVDTYVVKAFNTAKTNK